MKISPINNINTTNFTSNKIIPKKVLVSMLNDGYTLIEIAEKLNTKKFWVQHSMHVHNITHPVKAGRHSQDVKIRMYNYEKRKLHNSTEKKTDKELVYDLINKLGINPDSLIDKIIL